MFEIKVNRSQLDFHNFYFNKLTIYLFVSYDNYLLMGYLGFNSIKQSITPKRFGEFINVLALKSLFWRYNVAHAKTCPTVS